MFWEGNVFLLCLSTGERDPPSEGGGGGVIIPKLVIVVLGAHYKPLNSN